MDSFAKNTLWLIVFIIIAGTLANLDARGYFCGMTTWTTCVEEK